MIKFFSEIFLLLLFFSLIWIWINFFLWGPIFFYIQNRKIPEKDSSNKFTKDQWWWMNEWMNGTSIDNIQLGNSKFFFLSFLNEWMIIIHSFIIYSKKNLGPINNRILSSFFATIAKFCPLSLLLALFPYYSLLVLG